MENKPTDQTLYEDVKRLFDFHQEQVEKYGQILAILDNKARDNGIRIGAVKIVRANPSIKTRERKGGTFESRVISMLSAGVPLSVREIKIELNKRGDKQYTNKTVATQLRVVKRNKKSLENQILSQYTLDYRNVWGLSEWFENDALKPEYLKRFAEKAK